MNERIRIDVSDLARAPDQPGVGTAAHGPATGEIFSTVEGIAARPDMHVPGAAWRSTRILFPVAGIVAALVASFLTDGLAGYGRYEATGREAPWWIAFLLMCAFSSLLTMCIAAADDVASGAVERGLMFGAIGFFGGLVSGVIGLLGGGLAFTVIGSILMGEADTSQADVATAMAMRAPAWLILGLLCGTVVGALGRSLRRAMLGAIGGAIGGLLGGLLFDPVAYFLSSATASRLIGLLAMGAATGFAIAYAESAAKQAWLSIERGRLIGKQFIIYRNPTAIGAAYSNDVFLFKDPAVAQMHARISKRGGGFLIEALAGALVRVNGQPVASRPIGNGDTVQIGETLMRFQTRS